ncbi:hypothetical protein PYCC9005_005783 [Savitreella phatthalungensis]
MHTIEKLFPATSAALSGIGEVVVLVAEALKESAREVVPSWRSLRRTIRGLKRTLETISQTMQDIMRVPLAMSQLQATMESAGMHVSLVSRLERRVERLERELNLR